MDLISSMQCNSTYFYNGRIHATNLCAGYPEGRVDTCQVTAQQPQLLSGSLCSTYSRRTRPAGCSHREPAAIFRTLTLILSPPTPIFLMFPRKLPPHCEGPWDKLPSHTPKS